MPALAVPFFALDAMRDAKAGGLTTSNRRYDAYFVAVTQLRILVLQEPDVFLVDVDVYEPAHSPGLIKQPILNAWIARLKFGNSLAYGCAIDLDEFFVVGQLPKWCWDSNFLCHKLTL